MTGTPFSSGVASGAGSVARSQRVLLVDPYRSSREGLQALLVATGWSVETAGTVWEAIKRMKDEPFDIAIVDLDLPPAPPVAVSGWDLARILRAFNPQVALVLVGAEPGPDAEREAARLGRVTLLEKPVSRTRLQPLVRALSGEPAR
jgi:CheY-like chemotaxis protein